MRADALRTCSAPCDEYFWNWFSMIDMQQCQCQGRPPSLLFDMLALISRSLNLAHIWFVADHTMTMAICRSERSDEIDEFRQSRAAPTLASPNEDLL
ncbi:hypothetical protein PG990_011873 [Apiospora arundinis]|uniref:Uncharacterized protein n=1 Tax=Apiospora arundinis TaxID=335852 RepID=A0ABR2HP08_9PEZI